MFFWIQLPNITETQSTIPRTMSGTLEAAAEEMQRLRRQLKEREEQVQQAAHAGLDLLNQQVELQTRLEDQRVEMTNAMEVWIFTFLNVYY